MRARGEVSKIISEGETVWIRLDPDQLSILKA